MAFAEGGETVEHGGPDAYKKDDHEEPDHPWLRVLRGEEEPPISSVWRGEEIVLDDDGDEEPNYNLSACKRAVEGRDSAGCLAVIGWEAEVKYYSYSPQEEREGDGNGSESGAVGNEIRGENAV